MSAYLSTTERAAVIRRDLKQQHGWTPRDVSVRADYYSMGSSIRIVIKRADVLIAKVKAIAEGHESIDRDDYTGEILSGGNRFVDVSYSHEACDVLRERMIAVVRKAALELDGLTDNCLVTIEGTPYLLGRGQHGRGYWVLDLAAGFWRTSVRNDDGRRRRALRRYRWMEPLMKTYTVGDLRTVPPGTFQYCVTCGGEYSADHRDYFGAARGDATPLTCCGSPVLLVLRKTSLRKAVR